MSWRLIKADPAEGGELPATEFVHPLPILCLIVLGINDHMLKGAGLIPSVITGKLSDFTGLFFFPLLLTACYDVLLFGLNKIMGRHRLNASLTTAKLVWAATATAALFTAIKLSPEAARLYGLALAKVDPLGLLPPVKITQDFTDLIALPMCAAAVWFGRSRLGEIPPARLAALIERVRAGQTAEEILHLGLEDCRRVAKRPKPTFLALVNGLSPWVVAQAKGKKGKKALERAERALAGWRL